MMQVNRMGNPLIIPQPSRTTTTNKVHVFLHSPSGVGTVFSLLAGVATAALWGIPVGLLVLGSGLVITGVVHLAIQSCRRQAPSESIPLTREIINQRNQRLERETAHLKSLALPSNVHRIWMALHMDHPDLDICQLQVEEISRVLFRYDYRPMGGTFVAGTKKVEGHQVRLSTPDKEFIYYMSPQECVEDAVCVAPLS